MSHCKGCKREISWGKKDCPFCGTSRGVYGLNVQRMLVLSLIFGTLAVAGHQYLDHRLRKTEENINNQNQLKIENANSITEQLQLQNKQLTEQLNAANAKLLQNEQQNANNSTQAQALTVELQQKLDESEKSLEKEKSRAGWLGRENVRLKNQLKELQEKANTMTPTQEAATQSTPTDDNVNNDGDGT